MRLAHLIRLEFITQIIFGEECNLWSLSLLIFSPASCYFILLPSKGAPQHPVRKDTQSVFLPHYQRVSHPNKTTNKTVVQYTSIFTLLDSRWRDKLFWTDG
jgi:hypothetical protein